MMEHWSIVDDYTSAVIFPFHPIPSSHRLSFSEIVMRFSHHFLPTNDFHILYHLFSSGENNSLSYGDKFYRSPKNPMTKNTIFVVINSIDPHFKSPWL